MESETGLEKAFSVLPTVTECVCVQKREKRKEEEEKRRRRRRRRRRRTEHVVSLCGAQEVGEESVSERASQRGPHRKNLTERTSQRESHRESLTEREPHRERRRERRSLCLVT